MKKFNNLTSLIPTMFLILLITIVAGCNTDKNGAVENKDIEWLFVQNAESVTLNDGVLILNGINPTTVCFTDRPERMAALTATEKFVNFWNGDKAKDSFEKDPPNATLSVVTESGANDVVLTLSNPVLENEALKYDVSIIEGNDMLTGGAASLFIDVIGRPLTPVSVAGVARRTTRRTVRRMAY